MLKKLIVVIAILALASPVLGVTVSKDGTQDKPVTSTPTVPENGGDREDFEYNTAGPIDAIPDTGGSASGWCWYQTHVLTNGEGSDVMLTEVAACTVENSDDPVALPVEWVIEMDATIGDIADPYIQDWDYRGDFMPSGPPDQFPPVVYDYIDISGEGIVWPMGVSMVWGFENAGLIGQIGGGPMDTYGWWEGVWEPDSNWGRTGVQQVKGNYVVTPTEEVTFSQVKALY
jgi:hypothetical protein